MMEATIGSMDFGFFAKGKHKMDMEEFLSLENALLLDVRFKEEVETIKIRMEHHCPVLEIPLNEVPSRVNEIPRDKTIGVFCSSGVRNVIIFTYLKSMGYEKVHALEAGYAGLFPAVMPGKVFKKVNV